MKKVLLSGMITLSTMTILQPFQNEAEATKVSKSNINYTSKSVVKKIKNGTLMFDGVKLGTKVSTLTKNKSYNYESYYDRYNFRNSRDSLFMDFQQNIQLKNRKINRIEDDNVSSNRVISRTKMLKSYGKPLATKKVKSGFAGSKTIYYIDFYKNVTFIYNYDTKSKTYLNEVQFKKYTNKTNFLRWQKFVIDNFNNIVGNFDYNYSINNEYWYKY